MQRGGEGEGAAVEDVFAALPGDQRVEGAERAALVGKGEDVVRRAFADPVPGRQLRALAEVVRCAWIAAGQPAVEQAQATPMQLATVAAELSGDSAAT